MAKRKTFLIPIDLQFDQDAAGPMYRRLYDRLRESILSGRLAAGTRLPSTRDLAKELHIARNTVLQAYEQLLAEGYVTGKTGAGTFVSDTLPDDLLNVAGTRAETSARGGLAVSKSGRRILESPLLFNAFQSLSPAGRWLFEGRAFRAGLPATDEFPFPVWSRLAAKRWRAPGRLAVGYGDPAGYEPLRREIARYLTESRGVVCDPEQVIVVSGSQQGMDVAVRVVADPGDAVLIEDPCYLGAKGAFMAAGMRLVPADVDGEGIGIRRIRESDNAISLCYVTPSHQFPLGMAMSLTRRLELLDWANTSNAWIIEDDYDSEYRFSGRPLAALQGLDRAGRVLYLGTFSKVLLPALRLGYLVVPPNLVEPMVRARSLVDRFSPTVEQTVLADFMAEGHFVRHIRKMRQLYAERRETLVGEITRRLAGAVDLVPSATGLHVTALFPDGRDDAAFADRAAAAGLLTVPLSQFCLENRRSGIILGYGSLTPAEIRFAVDRLARLIGKT